MQDSSEQERETLSQTLKENKHLKDRANQLEGEVARLEEKAVQLEDEVTRLEGKATHFEEEASRLQDELDRLRKAYERLSFTAEHDGLTGIYTRQAAIALIENAMATSKGPFILAFVDVDNFKCFNNTYDYQSGDEILVGYGSHMLW